MIFSCSKKEVTADNQNPEVSNKGSLQFDITDNIVGGRLVGKSTLRTAAQLNELATYVQVSIDSGTKTIYNNEIIALQKIGSQTLSLPISLAVPATGTATFTIKNFSVLDASKQIIMGTPLKGTTIAATAVGNDFALPVALNLKKDSSAKMRMKVVEINPTSNPADFGYSTFTFNLALTYQGLSVAPMYFKSDAFGTNDGNFILTPATLEIWQQTSNTAPFTNARTLADTTVLSTTAKTINLNMPVFNTGSNYYRVKVSSASLGLYKDTVLHKDSLRNHFAPVGSGGKGALILIMDKPTVSVFKQIYFNDFESATATAAADDSLKIEGYRGGISAGNYVKTLNPTVNNAKMVYDTDTSVKINNVNILGVFGRETGTNGDINTSVILTVPNTNNSDTLLLEFDFYAFDSWDGFYNGSNTYGPDYFTIYINNKMEFNATFSNYIDDLITKSYIGQSYKGENNGDLMSLKYTTSYNNTNYTNGLTGATKTGMPTFLLGTWKLIYASDNKSSLYKIKKQVIGMKGLTSIKIKFTSDLVEAGVAGTGIQTESWGIDNLKVSMK